jgi:hypothetical protein
MIILYCHEPALALAAAAAEFRKLGFPLLLRR